MIENMWLHYLILITIYVIYNLPYLHDKFSLEEQELVPCSVVILVLSARNNYENRQAIRKTWVQAANQFKNVCYAFVIGNECVIPTGDRIDQYGCQNWTDHTSDLNPRGEFISNSFEEREFPIQQLVAHGGSPWYTGIGFKVLYPVTLYNVGVHIKVVPTHGSIRVMLRDATSNIFTIQVTKQSCSSISNGFCFQHLKENVFHLPKLYEAEVFIQSGPKDIEYHAPYVDCNWVNGSAVHYTFGKVNNLIEPFDPNRCSIVTLIFKVDDAESLKGHFQRRSFRDQSHSLSTNESKLRLEKEVRDHKDVAFLPDVVDVYRNLPSKLLTSLIWSTGHFRADFVLKVDDDSYVNVKRLKELISSLRSDFPPSIFGGFLHHAGTNQFGKWAEVDYSSMSYPSFPTGAGYLLTGNLVSLLVEASPYLKPFQGEDVSMAIWVESLTGTSKDPSWHRIKKIEIKCWLSVPKCPVFYIKQQLTPQMMYKLHYNL